MMRCFSVLGSPRNNANSTIIARTLTQCLAERGVDVTESRLGALSFGGCIACGACKGRSETCVLKDDLAPVLAGAAEAELLLLATPVYFGDVSGQMKCFLDRTYSFFAPDFSCRIEAGKRGILILTQGDGRAENHEDVGLRYRRWFLEWYGFADMYILRGLGLNEAGEAAQRSDLLEQARSLAQKLA